MRMHRIEVDDKLLTFLKKEAEPFVDTPNTVLRRLLLNDDSSRAAAYEAETSPGSALPEIPAGTPKALEQVLEVVRLVKTSSRSRVDATHLVANRHHIAFQTVLDKYCRQLGFTASEFDDLLRSPGLTELKQVLKKRFSRHSDLVEAYLP